MVRQGAKIPTAWLIIVPIVGFYWLYMWFAGVEEVTQTFKALPFFLAYMAVGVASVVFIDPFQPSVEGSETSGAVLIADLLVYCYLSGILMYAQSQLNKTATGT